jgi:uncharacterized membrane protein
MGTVLILHQGLSNMAWMFFLAIGLWGLYRAIRSEGVDGSYLGAAAVGQILFWVQGVLGVILWINGRLVALQRAEVHILYGAFVMVFLPFMYITALRGDDSNRGMWVLAFSNLFLFGVALRLIELGT